MKKRAAVIAVTAALIDLIAGVVHLYASLIGSTR